MVIVDSSCLIVGGVDTHRDVNVAAVVDRNGGLLGVESFRTTAASHKLLASWMSGFGTVERIGVEGTGTYGASMARHLARTAVTVIEVDRPSRQQRRQHGKSDQLDAIEAARAALSGRCTGRAVQALDAELGAIDHAATHRAKSAAPLTRRRVLPPDEPTPWFVRDCLAGPELGHSWV